MMLHAAAGMMTMWIKCIRTETREGHAEEAVITSLPKEFSAGESTMMLSANRTYVSKNIQRYSRFFEDTEHTDSQGGIPSDAVVFFLVFIDLL